jgi:hypothetical protein
MVLTRCLVPCLGVVLMLSCALPARAQGPTTISESKRQRVLELVEAMNQQTSMEKVVDAVVQEMDRIMDASFEELVNSSDAFTPEEKDRMLGERRVVSELVAAKFRERFLREVDFPKLQQELFLTLYDKYFTEDEIVAIVAFYRTPAGQKTLRVLPELTAEAMRRSQELLGPQLVRIGDEVVREALEELRKRQQSGGTKRAA